MLGRDVEPSDETMRAEPIVGPRELEALRQMKQDNEWLEDRYSELEQRFAGRFVAIRGGTVIADSNTLNGLMVKLKKERPPQPALIEFIADKDFVMIL